MNIARQRGFTLIEIMVVVVLAGILLAMTAVTAFPDDRSKLRTEADRLAQLWMIAHDEAQVRGTPVLWEATPVGYRFVIRDGPNLVPIQNDSALRARAWEVNPVQIARSESGADTASNGTAGSTLQSDAHSVDGTPIVRLVFARASAQDPVAVALQYNDARVLIRGDGLGSFAVETP